MYKGACPARLENVQKKQILMASIKLKFRPSATEGKEGALFFQVTHRRASRTVFTGCRVMPGEWDEASSAIRITGTPERQARLRWGARQMASAITEREAAMVEYTAADIVSAYRQKPPFQTWFGFIRSMARSKAAAGREGTAKTYRDALSSFAGYRGGEDMAVDSLDGDTMSRYEAWLKGRGLKRNSSSCYLRTLRTLYRKAVEAGLAADGDIFRHVFTGFAKTPKRAVTLAAVRAVRALSLSEGSGLAFARDMFMLSVYMQGMSFVDMAYLRKSDIRNGQLQYVRRKTRQTLTVSWEPPMQAIVDRYARLTEGSPFLLPVITRRDGTERRQYEKMEHSVNRSLKKLGDMAGLRIPLTTYVARHTWASAMRDMGCDLSTVSCGLGHESLRTTQIYLSAIDTADVARANRKMLRRILK